MLFCACSSGDLDMNDLDGELKPMQTSYNTTITYSVKGSKKSVMFAPIIEQYQNDSTYFILNEGFDANFFDSLGVNDSGIEAEYGLWFKDQQRMIAKKNVVAFNQAGDSIFTEELTWLQDTGLIFTDKFVTIKKPDAIIYGDGLEAKEDFSEYFIKSIRGQIAVEENEEIP